MSVYFKVLVSSAKKIRTDKIEGNELLLFSAINNNGNIVIEKNTPINDKHKEILKNWGIKFVIVAKPEEIWVSEKELDEKKMQVKEKIKLDEQQSKTIEKVISKDTKNNVDDLKKISNDLKNKVDQLNLLDKKYKIKKIEKKIDELVEKKKDINNQIQNIEEEETKQKLQNALALKINELIEEVKKLDINESLIVDIIEAENIEQEIKTELINEILDVQSTEQTLKQKQVQSEIQDKKQEQQFQRKSFKIEEETPSLRKTLYKASEDDKITQHKELFTKYQEESKTQYSEEIETKNISNELLKEITHIDKNNAQVLQEEKIENKKTEDINIEKLLGIKEDKIKNIKEILDEEKNLVEDEKLIDEKKLQTEVDEEVLDLIKKAQKTSSSDVDKPVFHKTVEHRKHLFEKIKNQDLKQAQLERKRKLEKLKEKSDKIKSSREIEILQTFHKIYALPSFFSRKELQDIFLLLNGIFDQVFYEAKVDEIKLEKAVNLIDKIADESKFIILDIAESDAPLYYLFVHSVNVAIFAGILAKLNGVSSEENRLLITAAIFHDIGMCFVPESFWHRPKPLTPRGEYEVKKHPLYSANLIKKIFSDKQQLYKIVLQHHERLDGTGYPYRLKQNKIDFLAQILSIADVYEAMTAERFYRGNYSLEQVIKYFVNERNKYNWNVLKTLIKKVGFYPNGTVVILSDNSIGFIKKQNPKNILKPFVQRLLDKDRKVIKTESIIDLNNSNLHIIRSIPDRKALLNIKERFNLWN